MCMLGTSVKTAYVPRSKAIVAWKLFSTTRPSNHKLYPQYRKRTWFFRGKFVQCHYTENGIHRTVKPIAGAWPDWGNGRGFWAWRTRCLTRENRTRGARVRKVFLWGQVVEHQLGYRAEFCKVLKGTRA